MVDSSADYLRIIERRLAETEPEAEGIQLAVYYAGVDPHEGSAFGGMPGFDARLLEARDRLVFDWLPTSLNTPVMPKKTYVSLGQERQITENREFPPPLHPALSWPGEPPR